MNLLKTLTIALLAAAALPGVASAQNYIYISGSTAFRAPTTCAIIKALTNNSADGNVCYGAVNGSTFLKGQSGILADGTVSFNGTTFTGTATTIVETNWTGSLAGVLDVAAQNTTLTFPDPTNTAVESALKACTTSPFGGTGNLGSGYATVTKAPNVCMSDSFASSAAAVLATAQVSSGHTIGGQSTGAGLKTLVTNAPLAEAGTTAAIVNAGKNTGYLGIVPFEWVLGNLSNTNPIKINGVAVPTPSAFTNITQQTASFLTHAGYAPFTMFSKVAGDSFSAGDFVYLIGRNEDSGTRIDALAEPQPLTGFAINPSQYLLSFSGSPATTTDNPAPTDGSSLIGGSSALVVNLALWPANAHLNTEQFITWNLAGHSGYSGGGDVSSVIGTPVDEQNLYNNDAAVVPGENTGNAYFIGYLGTADAGGFNLTTIPGGTALTYNGVTCTTQNIDNGSYSFWSYEHMYYLTSGTGALTGSTSDSVTTSQLGFVTTIANSIATTYAPYSNNGVNGDGIGSDPANGAGVLLEANAGTTATTNGNVSRTVEGGPYSLNY